MLARLWGKGNPHTLLPGILISITITENNVEFLKNLEIDLPYDPTVTPQGIHPKEMKSDTCTPCVHCTQQLPRYEVNLGVRQWMNG